jgi:hypothetical protein
MGGLITALNELAEQIINELNQPDDVLPTLNSLQRTLKNTQTFKSFLNLEYYDLLNWLNEMAHASSSADIRSKCLKCIKLLRDDVIRFERHTSDLASNGISIFFNHHLVPENIYTAHQAMYLQTRFSQDTLWDDLIDTYRNQMKIYRSDLLLYQCRLAYLSRNMESFSVILKKIFRIMSHNIQMGRVREAQKYIAFFKMLPASDLPDDLGRELQQMINRDIELQ